MSINSRNRIETEKHFYEEAVLKRLGELKKHELQDTKMLKDTRLRHLKAKVKQANRRLLAISKIEKQIEDSARRKTERLEKRRTGVKTIKQSSQTKINKKKKKEQAERSLNAQNGVTRDN